MSVAFICRQSIIASATPITTFTVVYSDCCTSVEVQSAPLILSIYTPDIITISKYSKSQTTDLNYLIYSVNISQRGYYDVSEFDGYFYVISSIARAQVVITTMNFAAINCTDIFIENTPAAARYFRYGTDNFFVTNVTNKHCYLFAGVQGQTVRARIELCQNCPNIELHEGPIFKIAFRSDSIYEYTQQSDNYPFLITVFPSENNSVKIDLPFFRAVFNVSRPDMYNINGYNDWIRFSYTKQDPKVIDIYIIDWSIYGLSGLLLILSIAISVFALHIHCKNLKSGQFLNSTYPLISNRNIDEIFVDNATRSNDQGVALNRY